MKPVYGFMLGIIFVVAWWSAAYPEFAVKAGSFRVLDENNNDITDTLTEREIATGVFTASEDKIVMKSAILELFTSAIEGSQNNYEEKSNDREDRDYGSWLTIYFRREERGDCN